MQAVSAWQERLFKDLHAHPELSFQETKTATLTATKFKEGGYEVIEGIGRTGVVGVLRNVEGLTVLARADMDALPIKENTDLFNVLMVITAIIAIIVTVPKDDRRGSVSV